MFFYAIFTFVLFFRMHSRLLLSAVVFCIFFGLGQFSANAAPRSILAFYGSGQIFEFWVGMLIGQFYVEGRLRLPRYVSVALVVAGFALLLVNYQSAPPLLRGLGNGVTGFLVPAAAIVLGVVALERDRAAGYHWLPALLGDASYSLYLGHVLFLGLARVIWPRLLLPDSGPLAAAAFAVFSLTIALCGAVALYKFVEMPAQDYLRSAYERWWAPTVPLAKR
jgi:exopolysaccharide production protein ExoZ